MKIRVTLILLLCTSIRADRKNTIKDQRISTNNKFTEKKDHVKRFVPRHHRIYEYSRSMETMNVDFTNGNSGMQNLITKPVYNTEAVNAEALPSDWRGSMNVESGRSLKQLPTLRMNSKQPSQIFQVDSQPLGDKVVSRKKKNQMEQAMLALLMAYKMKFTALIPILLGGLSLLASTTALAGFFFALFAAVLGLKAN